MLLETASVALLRFQQALLIHFLAYLCNHRTRNLCVFLRKQRALGNIILSNLIYLLRGRFITSGRQVTLFSRKVIFPWGQPSRGGWGKAGGQQIGLLPLYSRLHSRWAKVKRFLQRHRFLKQSLHSLSTTHKADKYYSLHFADRGGTWTATEKTALR